MIQYDHYGVMEKINKSVDMSCGSVCQLETRFSGIEIKNKFTSN